MKKTTIFKAVFTVLMLLLNTIINARNYFGLVFKFKKKLSLDRSCLPLKAHISIVFVILFLLVNINVSAQEGKKFLPRLAGGNIKVKGDLILIGNTVLNKADTAPIFSPSAPVNGVKYTGTVTNLTTLTSEANQDNNASGNNNDFFVEYIDIDGDPNTFSSSSAELKINNSCKKIVFAGLYWSAIYPYDRSTDTGDKYKGSLRDELWNEVKFKIPQASSYVDIVADEIIFNGYKKNGPNVSDSFKDSPYVCFKDVTTLLGGLADAEGVYTLANVRAARGKRDGGSAGGWTLLVIYESPTLPSKFISVFDGYVGVNPDSGSNYLPAVNFDVSGFKTLPVPFPVRAKMGVAALEGDYSITGDSFEFKASTSSAFTTMSDLINPANNFFNATISDNGVIVTNRTPKSKNTLGIDIDNVQINNPLNSVLPNDATAGTLRLTTNGDGYGAFVTTFAVEIIEPKIQLTKEVQDVLGNDIGNTPVRLGDYLYYKIGFQNVGNDDATSFTIKDILPINIIFDPADVVVPNGSGITFTHDQTKREIIFTVPNNLVKINDPRYEINFKVQVVPNCNDLSDACSDQIKNQAFATYKGAINPNQITDDPSVSSFAFCNLDTPSATNFLVDVDDCEFTKDYILCGASVDITAANGYDRYSWSTSPTGTPVIGTTQAITVTQPGIYYVHNTAVAPCLSINQKVTVSLFGSTITNPVIPFADEVVQCPNDGKDLPNIYLCGANATRLIQTGIHDATSIVWEKLDIASCTAVSNSDCANENTGCTWESAGPNGPDFTANISGQFRMTIYYSGGCFSRFYFNVYQNPLHPTVTSKDIICNTQGEITVGGVPLGYEYSLDNVNYQISNVFPISTPNSYTVYIKQIGVGSFPCIFSVPGVFIRKRDFTVSPIAIQPLCNGGKGAIKLAANDVRGQYYYKIYQGTDITQPPINQVGPIAENSYTFPNLNAGTVSSPITYTWDVSTDDGCHLTGTVNLQQPDILTATAVLTKSLTCTDGEITVTPIGGTAPYSYFVNSTTDFQSTPQIVVTQPLPLGGVYSITVVDNNNCSTTTSITVTPLPAPVYTVDKTGDILCYGSNTGEIKFNVTNANGYTLSYGISTDNGVTYTYGPNPTISNLIDADYYVVLKYSLNGIDCLDTPQKISIRATTSLTAVAGVSELAGCGPNGEGKVRITNPQGGTPFPGLNPYLYSFDNQATWVTTNEAYLNPGTYTLYMKDAVGCVFPMPGIVLDQKPNDPTISVSDPVYNCNGSANSTVTVTNNGGLSFSYNYLMDGNPNTNTPSNVFVNVPSGPHNISVDYTLTSVPTYSNLLKEDFGSGAPTTSPGIAAAYCFNDQAPPYTCPEPTRSVENNQYSVASDFWRNDRNWYPFKDHTTAANAIPDPKGRYLMVNIGSAAGPYGVLYSKDINDVIPNQPVKVELYVGNLLNTGIVGDAPDFIVELVDSSGNVVSTHTVGKIAEAPNDPNRTKWIPVTMSLNPGIHRNLTFKIRSGSLAYSGNDAVLDDIKVYQLPKVCATKKDFPFIVPTGTAFTASVTGHKDVKCAGQSNGEITIAAQNFKAPGFEYSINGGSWINQPTTPFTITGLGAGNYIVKIRYDNTSTGSACNFTFTQEIKDPAPITLSASETSTAKCNIGATITAVSSGGTGAHEYQLENTTGGIIRPYQSSPNFYDVPSGNYTVYVRDANLCSSTVGTTVNVVAPPTPTVTATVDQCTAAGSSFSIKAVGASGTPPYTYTINTGVSPSPADTFTVAAGTYTITVKDANNCSNTVTVNVYDAMTATAVLTKDLTCSVPTEATIRIDATGGKAGYNYKVSLNGGSFTAPTLPDTIVGNVFSTSTAGVYRFEVTDSNVPACTKITNPVTVTATTATPITASFTKVDPTCNGFTDGSIKLTGIGQGPFAYSITGLTGTFVSTNVFGGLPAGTYNYVVKDSKGCVFNDPGNPIVLIDPAPIVVNIVKNAIKCDTNTPGSLDVNVTSGGIAPYVYRLYDNSFTQIATYTETNPATTPVHNFAGLNFGDYYVTVVDANGCEFKSAKLRIETPPYMSMTGIVDSNSCATGVNVTVTTSGGTGPYRYSIFGQPLTETAALASNSYTFTGLTHGVTYFLQVKDVFNCISILEQPTPNSPSGIKITGTTSTDVSCNGAASGTLAFTVEGYDSTVTSINYEVLNALTLLPVSPPITGILTGSAGGPVTGNITTLPAGNYVLKTTEATGTLCSAAYTFEIKQPTQPLLSTISSVVNANCNNPAQITLTTTGGTGPYTYAFAVQPTTPTAFASGNVLNLDPGGSGTDLNWNIIVKDANECTFPLTTTIIKDPSPVIALAVVDKCVAEGTFEIDVTQITAGVSPYTISVNGSTFISIPGLPYKVSGLNSGSNTIVIKDVNGCTDSKTVTIDPLLMLSPSVTKLPTCIDADGEVTLTASGGSTPANYEYSIDGGTYVVSNVFTGLAPSATPYTFYVKDMDTNCIKSVSVLIDLPNQTINFGLTKTDPTCQGDSDGTITVNLDPSTTTVNNNPSYRYTLSGPVSRPIQDANIFTGLPAGDYTVTVTSGRGCTVTQPITVTQPNVIAVPSPTVAEFGCTAGTNGMNYATITVNGVTGGSGNYLIYEFIKNGISVQSGGSNTYTDTDLLGGPYTIKVYDDKGCSGTTNAVINPFVKIDFGTPAITVNNPITCTNGEDITVNVTTTGIPIPVLNYEIHDVVGGVPGTFTQANNTGVFTDLPIGNYIITVINPATGCSIQTVHYVNNPNTFAIKADNINNVICYGSAGGSVDLTFVDNQLIPTDEAGAFNYVITGPVPSSGSAPSAGPITITGLVAGIYTVTATLSGSPFCSVSTNFTIEQPTVALAIAETHTEITCATGNHDGTISATATGGWPGGYEFELVGPTAALSVAYSTQTDFTGLTQGLYTLNARDSKGCIVSTTVNLVNPSPISATIIVDKPLLACFGNRDATITVTSATGGSTNYLYTLVATYPDGTITSNGPQQSNVFNGLGAGSYQVQVSDNWSCLGLSNPITITEPTEIKPSLVLASRLTCTTPATLTLSATGGTPPYTYSADGITYGGSFNSSTPPIPVPVGTYHYYVRDANGCTSYLSNGITVDPLDPLIIDTSKSNLAINCTGENTGVITATAQGGLGNYIYTLLNGTGTAIVPAPVQSSPGNFTGLLAGNYIVHVDSGDCFVDKPVTITEPTTPPLTASYTKTDVKCNGAGDGMIVVTASGGTGIIKYAISPRLDQFFDSGIFDNLTPGIYEVIAQDQNGCFIYYSIATNTAIEIKEPTPIMVQTTILQEEICFDDKDGEFSINISGGIQPYKVSLDKDVDLVAPNYITLTPADMPHIFSGLTGGEHTVYIIDANGCPSEMTVSMAKSVNIDPIARVDYACVNNAPGNVVTVTVGDDITNPDDVEFSLDGMSPYQQDNVFTDVIPGSHFIRARHTNGCEKDTPVFTITQFDPLVLTLADGELNEIVATATGGAGGYRYTFNGEDNGGNNKYIIYKSGDYTVTVTDENGCVASANRYFEYIDICIPNYFTPNGDGTSDGWAPGCTENYKDLVVKIFDRYGRAIATLHVGEKWDGKYNRLELPSGDYWYILKLNDVKDAREFVGHFTLYR